MDFVGIMAAVPIGGAIFHIWVMLLGHGKKHADSSKTNNVTTLNLLYFARLRDALAATETLTLDGAATVASLLDTLRARRRGPNNWTPRAAFAWRSTRLSPTPAALADGDEVRFSRRSPGG